MDTIDVGASQDTVFATVEKYLREQEIAVHSKDENRPWGGFFVIDESSLATFIEVFFPDFTPDQSMTLSPKILLVEPEKRLSWQYHFRRSEIWTIVKGPVGIVLSDSDEQNPHQTFETGDQVIIEQGKRHRLVGLDEWGVIAEIWNHADAANPSDENDIVRVEDDFGR